MEKFTKDLEELSKRIMTLKDKVNTEEATKTALILPFFQKLGYDVFNPLEFTPEYIADVGIKKGEKVDYAIMENGNPTILIECKSVNEQLTNHDSQLFRYFGTSTSKFGILTNGIEYRFFTDLEEVNKMDSKPFLVFDLLHLKDNYIKEIHKFTKELFNIENISSSAYELKYVNLIKAYLTQELDTPSEEFVKVILNSVYDGLKTKSVIDRFTPTIRNTFNLLINEMVTNKLNAALNTSSDNKIEVKNIETTNEIIKKEDSIITTPEELETYAIIKVILSDSINTDRINYRDNKSYFNILIDNNIRKWIARIYFTKKRNYLIINDDDKTTLEFSTPIDILNYKNELNDISKKFL